MQAVLIIINTFFRFDVDELTKFTLTVRRNYRRVPYHNWTHAFSVAHCMFMILRKASSNFMLTEVFIFYLKYFKMCINEMYIKVINMLTRTYLD